MEQYGNTTTYNVESVLQKNIVASEYYRQTCMKLTTWEEVVDEIFYTVTDVEPWMSGNARGATSAFCLLFRLFTLKITEQQVKDLLDHVDSPYIRAVGFLYLRYVGNPKTLWQWLQPYVRDDEELTPSPGGKPVTLGAYVRDVFLEQYYFETIFPRIPKPVQDDFVAKLTAMGLPSKAVGNGGQGGGDRRGIEEGNRRPASVKASLSVAFGQRAPNRATAREEGRGLGAGMRGASGQARLDAQTAAGSSDRDRDRGRDRNQERERDRDCPRGTSHDDRRREHGSDRHHHHSDRDRHHSRDRSHRGEGHKRSREPDRDRDSKRNRDRDARNVFKESSGAARIDKLKDTYGDATRDKGREKDRERSRHSTKEGLEEVYRIGGR